LTAGLVGAVALGITAFSAHLYAEWQAGLEPGRYAYGAITAAMLAYQGLHVVVLFAMCAFTAVRGWAGLVDARRRMSIESTRLLWHYMVVQGIAAVVVLDLAPRLLSGAA